MTWQRRASRLALAAILLAAAYTAHGVREWFIQYIYVPGAGGVAPPDLGRTADDDRGLPPADRVRVVLIDGLGAYDVARVPGYQRACERTHLTVDVGFPTISLPIQHVLWTGLTQQQTGVLYFNRLIGQPPAGIPGQIGDSIAVAESHQYIAQSLGFARVLPEHPRELPAHWSLKASWRAWLTDAPADDFARAARDAVTSDARLAFVHILRVDTIAHKVGTEAPAYDAALSWASRVLDDLLASERALGRTGTRWFIMADHGHLPGGGHGGPESRIREVSLCISHDGRAVAPSGSIHLVDASRALADSLGVTLSDESAGRPLLAALATSHQPGATLPRPTGVRWLLVICLLLIGLFATAWAARGHWWNLPWWLPLAYLCVVERLAEPTLSTVWMRKPGGDLIYDSALPALLLLAPLAGYAAARIGALRTAIGQLALPCAVVTSSFVLCWATPPIMPTWTAHTSVLLVLCYGASFVVAVAAAMTALVGSRSATL